MDKRKITFMYIREEIRKSEKQQWNKDELIRKLDRIEDEIGK